MSLILTSNTSTESWQSLVQSALDSCDQSLDEELESYLVFMLMRNMGCTDLADNIIAKQYLQGMQSGGQVAIQQLQDVGDQCLLFSGLFPKQSDRRLVKVTYYIDLGRSAYSQMAQKMKRQSALLYERLAKYFVTLMDILQAMRCLDMAFEQDMHRLIEYAQDCGSARAKKLLADNNVTMLAWHDKNSN